MHASRNIEGVHAELLSDMVSVQTDLKFTFETLSLLFEEVENTSEHDWTLTHKALWNSALISFFKCFNSTKGRRYKLNRDLFKKSNEGSPEFFDIMKDLRDKHIAHSENGLDVTKIGLACDFQSGEILGLTSLSVRRDTEKPENIHTFGALTKFALDKVGIDIDSTQELILNWARKQDIKEIESWNNSRYIAEDAITAITSDRKRG